jgi:hypothetical protein
MERRMAALFLLALALIGWQGGRAKPLHPVPLSVAWTGGEQVFPISAPLWTDAAPPAELPARYAFLQKHSVPWPGVAAAGGCAGFIRTSASTWVRRGLDPERLAIPAGLPALRYAATDFLDDDDGDGDTLDAGELTRSGPGAEVEVFCPPPAGGAAQP